MQNIYKNGTYSQNNPSWHEQDSPWKARQILKMIERNNLAPSKICEIGCGAGEILRQLSEQMSKDTEFIGYEISPQAFDICRNKSKENLKFLLKDPFEDTETFFDIVLAIDVFEHVEDYFGFLRKIKKKGKYKIFHIPLDINVQMVLRAAFLKNRKSVGHIHYFTKETALASLEDTGHVILDYFYTPGALELPNQGWKDDLMKIPRKLFFSVSKDLTVRILGGFSLLVLTE
jgi:SAM-dependent methyltransferase